MSIEDELDRQQIFRNRMERCFGMYVNFADLRQHVCWENAHMNILTIEKLIDVVKVLTESMMRIIEDESKGRQ